MSTFKCEMCGGVLEIAEGATIAECEYCGNKIQVDNGKRETVHRIVDEARLKELERVQKVEEATRSDKEQRAKSVFKTKMILLAIWFAIVVVLWILCSCTVDRNTGFTPYQLLLIPVIIFGLVIIIKEIKNSLKIIKQPMFR